MNLGNFPLLLYLGADGELSACLTETLVLAVNNKTCFARVSGTHLWKIGLGRKFESSTSDLGKEEWQEA